MRIIFLETFSLSYLIIKTITDLKFWSLLSCTVQWQFTGTYRITGQFRMVQSAMSHPHVYNLCQFSVDD